MNTSAADAHRNESSRLVLAAAAPIRFGTMGWRGVLGEEVTFSRLRALVRGVSRWLDHDETPGRVLVGFDSRFASESMARIAIAVLAAEGRRALLSAGSLPTPALAHAVRRRRAAAGLVFTASHNPPEYHGVKVFTAQGRGVSSGTARRIESYAAAALTRPEAAPETRTLAADFLTPYRRALGSLLDAEALRRARPRVVYDALHGMGAGVLDVVLGELGVRVELYRGESDPRFGGGVPDPTAGQLKRIGARLRGGRGLRLGLATDGDADRAAALDEQGRVLNETEIVALLTDHLCRTGRARRGIAISAATGSLVEKVAVSHGLVVERRSMGFTELSAALCEGSVDLAGDESGGFALRRFGRDKDGILAGCLLVEMVAQTRSSLRAHLAGFDERFGRSRCGRRALAATPERLERLSDLLDRPPLRVESASVRTADREAGLRLALDDGFLMLRASGTEPVVRVYAEADGPRRLQRRLRWGEQLICGELPGSQ